MSSNPCYSLLSSRSRTERAESLALPPNKSLLDLYDKEQEQCNSIPLLTPANITRRHSSHYCPYKEDMLKTSSPKNSSVTSPISTSQNILPPPVPRRTFKGKIIIRNNQNENLSLAKTNIPIEDTISPTNISLFNNIQNLSSIQQNNNLNVINTSQIYDEYQPVFDDNPVFDDDKNDTNQQHNSRSSSESNRSHVTGDPGYISNGTEKTYSSDINEYRNRFSSVDTQSSVDSCFTEKTFDSPISRKSFIGINENIINNEIQISSKKKIETRVPVIPLRKQTSYNVGQIPPPIPPARIQYKKDYFDSIKSIEKQKLSDYSDESKTKKQKKKPPPLVHPRLQNRQDSSLSSDSYSLSSSPGYSSKSMEVPLLQYASKIGEIGKTSKETINSYGLLTKQQVPLLGKTNTSSNYETHNLNKEYNQKIIEEPYLPLIEKMNVSHRDKREYNNESKNPKVISPIIKSTSTPASLQAVVRFQNGSNMSLQHRIVQRRKSSNPYVTQGPLRFRFFQILINALVLLAIAGGLAAYFNAYPIVKFINKTIVAPTNIVKSQPQTFELDKNPAPGVCLPVIVKFCQQNHLPYNYTIFPNYIGQFGQPEAQLTLEAYEALLDVKCYKLVSLFLCSLFVPKCGPEGTTVPPCKTLCIETMRRCGFFFDIFNLQLPEYLTCNLFIDVNNPDECVGLQQVREARNKAQKPVCSGFLCDQKRCIPSDWRCDGHVDCFDQTDEYQCTSCGTGSIYCGENRCMSQSHVCDGIMDCPWGQDERNCIRLSGRNGDLGKGTLEIYKADSNLWAPACIESWNSSNSPSEICSMLGYRSVNSSEVRWRGTNMALSSNKYLPPMWRNNQRRKLNLLKEFSECSINSPHPVVELTCTNFECGKIKNRRRPRIRSRIVGGIESAPGDWPFLAAILGGPEEIFYCAGVLIADQWVLTATHCIGNYTTRNINDWTIQLGITRRHSHSYYGQKVKIRKVFPHPNYNYESMHDNDIALFQLASRVAFHEHLLPVCLPPPGLKELKPGTLCTVIGWGQSRDKNSNSNTASVSYEPTINEVQVPILKREVCIDWLETINVTDGMICAGYQEGGKDACQGDSGGPLLCRDLNDHEKWFVGGIVSWGIRCAHPKLPGVYANVPKYIPWILQTMKKNSKPNYDNNLG